MKLTFFSYLSALLFAGAVLLWGYSCTKPTAFGADLLDDQLAEYAYTDTLTLQCSVLPEDSLVTSDRSSTATTFLCGQLDDPVFGKSQSEVFSLFRLQDLSPNFKNANLDSIVLYVRFAPGGFYGDTTSAAPMQNLQIHRVAAGSGLRWDRDYYSNETLPVDELLGEATFVPRPYETHPLPFDTTAKGAYVRIPLNNAFGQELLDLDSLTLTSDTMFWGKLRGLRFTSSAMGSPGTLMAFDLNNTTYSRIRLYFKYDTDTITNSRLFEFSFAGGNKFVHFSHDYSGKRVAPYIGQPADDLLFVQGMSGLRLKIEIPYAHLLDDIAVNKAELALTAASLPEDDPKLRLADQVVFTEIIGDTTTTLTSDVLYSLGSTLTGGFSFFGGFPEKTLDGANTVDRYRMTLTRRFQSMVDNASGDIKKQTLYVNVYPQSRSATRAVFYGPKSTTFPAKLTLKYTRVR
ncbi:MAG: DUF4270 family protein [Saprospiraceae bacterium]|nr:DUF4270 family protein [Saprospiraceae bacterium]